MKKLQIIDSTLQSHCKSGENSHSFRELLNIALQLEKTGVDAIALPLLSDKKEDAVICSTIASSVRCGVCISAGDTEQTMLRAWDCVKNAANPCLQIVLPVSTVQMEYGYHLKSAKMLEKIAKMCKYGSELTKNIQFVAQDASRAEEGFAAACCKTAVENGASSVVVCDDGGVLFPEEFADLVTQVKTACGCPVLTAPSDALNMGTACAVLAVKAGADGIMTASSGRDLISAASVANILRARGEAMSVCSNLDTTAIESIFSQIEAGGAALPSAETAEARQLTLDASCSMGEIASAAGSLGYELTDEDMGKVYSEFTRVAERKAVIGTRELEAIIATSAMQVPSTFHLVSYVVNSGNIITATAHVTLEKNGQKFSGVSTGDGPIDAAFHALEQIIGHHYELDDFQIQSVTQGREAVGSSLIRLRTNGKLYSGNGISTDIVGASIRAYINALNKIVYEE